MCSDAIAAIEQNLSRTVMYDENFASERRTQMDAEWARDAQVIYGRRLRHV